MNSTTSIRKALDFAFGRSASGVEIAIPIALGAAGIAVAVACAVHAGLALAWWQWPILAFLAFDIVGGIAANASDAATRQHHRNGNALKPLFFTFFHVHPFAATLLLPVPGLVEATVLWGSALIGTALVVLTTPSLKRGVSLGFCGIAITLFAIVFPAPGLEWFAPCFLIKLVAAHAVPQRTSVPGHS